MPISEPRRTPSVSDIIMSIAG